MVSALIAHAQDAAPTAASTETTATAPVPEAILADATTALAAEPAPAAAVPAAAPADVSGSEAQLIVIDDTPLLDAIRNLARQAGLNLMIDPKVAYGQPDPTKPGTVTAQPNVSIRWENITAEQALNALLNNYNLQTVSDPKVKITRVTTKDPAAPDPLVTKTFQLSYSSPSNMLTAVSATLSDKRAKVVADVRTSQLVVVATEKELIEIEKLVAKLDTKTKQVLIEAKIIETTLNPKTSKGVDWTGTFSEQKMKFGNNPLGNITMNDAGSSMPGVPAGLAAGGSFGFNPAAAFLTADGLSATLSFINNQTDSKLVSEPRMVTLDNQKATIDVGLLYPIVNTTAGTANTTGGSQIAYSNLTVNLDVTPRIAANDQVELKVVQSIMRLGPSVKSVVGGVPNEVESFFTRQVQTVVLIPSANTLVLGGLISDGSDNGNIKVPVLGDIPVLGGLFRKDSKERNRQNMIIFITPTIVRDEDYQAASSTFLKTSPATEQDAEWSKWDSAMPVDWSKPKAQ